MSIFSKTAEDQEHVNTVVLHKIKIMFQVFPGTGGTDEQRGIAGVPFTVEIGPKGDFSITSTGKTAKDGGIDLAIPAGEIAVLTIFETDYVITVEDTIEKLTELKGVKRRLGWLGYYKGAINGDLDKQTDEAILNLQADSNLNAEGWSHLRPQMLKYIQEEVKKRFGE